MQVKTAHPNLVAFIMQRIFYGHVKVLKFSKYLFVKLLFWTGIYCFRSLRTYCIPNSIPLSFRAGEVQHRPEIREEMFQILYSSRSLTWSPDQVSDDKNIFFSAEIISKCISNTFYLINSVFNT